MISLRKQIVFGLIDMKNKQILELTPFNKEIEDQLLGLMKYYNKNTEQNLEKIDELDNVTYRKNIKIIVKETNNR